MKRPLALQKDSPTPFYYQIRDIIQEKITTNEWAPGTKIPSERELCDLIKVSRTTVRQAINSLVHEGVLVRVPGKGTFVNQPKLVQPVNRFYSFSDSLKRRNMTSRVQVISLSLQLANKNQQRILNLPPGDSVYELVRLRFGNQEPLLLERTILPAARFPNLELRDFEQRRLYDVMGNDYGIRLGVAQEAFEPVLVDSYEAGLLQVPPQSPALLIERVTLDNESRPVEWTKGVFRGDRCRYYVELSVPSDDAI
ncbi:MAG: GntR family transcriptional regulator [Betaproteobacteria bacterium]